MFFKNRHGIFIFLILLCMSGCASYSDFATSSTNSIAQATNTISGILKHSDNEYRRYLVSGDFNGDGYLDNAYAGVVNEDKWTLILHLDVLNDNGGEVILLEQHTPDMPVSEIRLKTLLPKKYVTFCGHMPTECSDASPAFIELKHDGILLIVLEASASIVYFDKTKKTYNRVWLAD